MQMCQPRKNPHCANNGGGEKYNLCLVLCGGFHVVELDVALLPQVFHADLVCLEWTHCDVATVCGEASAPQMFHEWRHGGFIPLGLYLVVACQVQGSHLHGCLGIHASRSRGFNAPHIHFLFVHRVLLCVVHAYIVA